MGTFAADPQLIPSVAPQLTKNTIGDESAEQVRLGQLILAQEHYQNESLLSNNNNLNGSDVVASAI